MHLGLEVLGAGPGDEVIVGDYTFPATGHSVMSVSYTHLTLPTSDLVEISVVAVSLKKKITITNIQIYLLV